MRKTKIFMLLAVLALCPGISPGQSRQYSAMVFDAVTSEPLANVNILVKETMRGTKTAANGSFTVQVKNGVTLAFSHISYEGYELVISDKNPPEIRLTKKVKQLEPITIVAPMPENLIGEKPYFIIDYEFIEDNLLMLGYNNSEFDPRLFLADKDGSIVTTVPVTRPEQLFRDCMGNVFLITKTTAYQIWTDGEKVELLYPVARSEFYSVYDKLVGHTPGRYFVKNLYNQNKTLVYFRYEISDSSFSELRVVEDREAIGRAKWGGYFNNHEEDIDFQQRIIAKPVYAPLMVINDTVNIFNYLDAEIEKYLPDGTLSSSCALEYAHDKQFREQMCYDESTGKVYALFIKNGKSSLREVDRNTGKLAVTVNIPEFVFVDNVKVNDGNVFFLYRENLSDGYKKLYRMKIGG